MLEKTFDPKTVEPRLYQRWEASGAFAPTDDPAAVRSLWGTPGSARAASGDALDLCLHPGLHDLRQMLVEPGLEQRPHP